LISGWFDVVDIAYAYGFKKVIFLDELAMLYPKAASFESLM
jgi:hypothetical protein